MGWGVDTEFFATLFSHRSNKNPSIMKLLNISILFVILLKCVIASVMGNKFRRAIDDGDFGWIGEFWMSLEKPKHLFDYVIAKGTDLAVKFINNVDDASAKLHVLAALFDVGSKEMVDDVLGKIDYNDSDLVYLMDYRPELANSYKFFNVLDKIKDLEWQKSGVRWGVYNLFEAGRHDLVVPLVNALEKRLFKNNCLREIAIRKAFVEGAERDREGSDAIPSRALYFLCHDPEGRQEVISWSINPRIECMGGVSTLDRGLQSIVEEYYEHPAITAEWYAYGLIASWRSGEPNQVFLFLLGQADTGDLRLVVENYTYKSHSTFRRAINEAFETAPPAGTRHRRPIERAHIAQEIFTELRHPGTPPVTVDIITGYITGDKIEESNIMIARKVFKEIEEPEISTVISDMIIGYMDETITHGKEQARMLLQGQP